MNNDFELWWETNGVARLRVLVANKSAHDAARELARAAWEEICSQFDLKDPAPEIDPASEIAPEIPAAVQTEIGSGNMGGEKPADGSDLVEDGFPAAGPVGSASVRCGTCQNCGLENFAGPDSDPVECSGCKYVGPLANIFERPRV